MESLRSQNLQTSGGKLCKVLRTGCSAGFQMIKSVGTSSLSADQKDEDCAAGGWLWTEQKAGAEAWDDSECGCGTGEIWLCDRAS